MTLIPYPSGGKAREMNRFYPVNGTCPPDNRRASDADKNADNKDSG
ncbi:hypothetical protein D083_4395 [Dickeya solani RNS 08.23.3.1.A]|nr:hypothetical protein D083_4395 [Dickeya solani RNS 08.23.3.1.A]